MSNNNKMINKLSTEKITDKGLINYEKANPSGFNKNTIQRNPLVLRNYSNIRNNNYHNQQHYHAPKQQNHANTPHSPFVSRCLNSGKRSFRDIEIDKEANHTSNSSDNLIKRSRFDTLSIFNAVVVSPLAAIKNLIMKSFFKTSPKAETYEAPVVESGEIYDYEQQRNAIIQK